MCAWICLSPSKAISHLAQNLGESEIILHKHARGQLLISMTDRMLIAFLSTRAPPFSALLPF